MAVLIACGSCEQATTKARVLDLPLQRRRDKTAAVKLMRRLFKNTASRPMCWLLTSCVHMPQRTELRLTARHGQGLRRNDRAENRICRFVRRRERKMQRSNRPAQRNGCCPFMPQSRTRSTSNAISFSAMRSALSEVKRFRIGRRRLRPEQEPSPATRSQVHVTIPRNLLSCPIAYDGPRLLLRRASPAAEATELLRRRFVELRLTQIPMGICERGVCAMNNVLRNLKVRVRRVRCLPPRHLE
jgi:hypothetical protein